MSVQIIGVEESDATRSEARALRVLHAYNQHRGGGGADNAARSTIELTRASGVSVEVFTRSSEALPKNLKGRLSAGMSAFYAPDSVREFRAALDRFKPDIVHIHEVFPLVSPWILPVCSERGIPVVMTVVDYRITCPIVTHLRDGKTCAKCTGGHEYWAVVHNCRENIPESVTVSLYNALMRKMRIFHKHVTRFIAPSEFTKKWIVANAGIDPAKVTTISPIVAIPPTSAEAADGDYIAFAGRFAREKGIDVLIEAARLTGLPFRLARNEQSMVNVAIPDNVHVVVTRSREELDAFYRAARMVVVPSLWFETFGLVGAEAMSHGIPVVASRIGALEYLVEDGVDGLLFEPGNRVDLADKIRRIWNDPELARTLGHNARRKAAALWGPEHHFERLQALYATLRSS